MSGKKKRSIFVGLNEEELTGRLTGVLLDTVILAGQESTPPLHPEVAIYALIGALSEVESATSKYLSGATRAVVNELRRAYAETPFAIAYAERLRAFVETLPPERRKDVTFVGHCGEPAEDATGVSYDN